MMTSQEKLEWAESHVCGYCGGKLQVQKVDDIEHICCMGCSKIEYGVDKDVFNLALEYAQTEIKYVTENEEYKKKWIVHDYAESFQWFKNKMKQQEKDDNMYLCIKDYEDKLIKGNKYEIMWQDKDEIAIQSEEDDFYVSLTYKEFDECFERKE